MREGLVLTGIAADQQGNALNAAKGSERVQTTQISTKKLPFRICTALNVFYYFSSLKVVNECMARNSVTVKYYSVTYLYQGVITQFFFEYCMHGSIKHLHK